jgi:mannose-6-phosphate isomerase-like protein (cupin superfamily)
MPALELRSIQEWLDDPLREPLPRPLGTYLTAKTLWGTTESHDFLNIEIHAIAPEGGIDPHYHAGFPVMLICWQGEGQMTVAESSGVAGRWNEPYAEFPIKQYDSIYVPPGALYRINAGGIQPERGLVLVAVHALQGQPFNESLAALGDPGAKEYPWIRHLAPDWQPPAGEKPLYDWDPNPKHRATRNRIWGKDGFGSTGEADPAKEYFHLVAYCFNPHQENPPHFHPRSVEFMLGLKGTALTYTRHKYPDDYGWDPTQRQKTIMPGDTALVGLADIHRYVNTTDDPVIVLALQTPQPIMHTLEHEVRLFKSVEELI